MIEIRNAKNFKGKGVYVGRKFGGFVASPLGNPFRGERKAAIAQYRKWLWSKLQCDSIQRRELKRLALIHKTNGHLVLICWCSPLPCHAEVIKRAIEWLEKGVEK